MADESQKPKTRAEVRKKAQGGTGNNWSWIQLGHMYENGDDGPVDHAEAMKCFRQIIDSETLRYHAQASGTARHAIGLMYAFGRGVEKNEAEAFKWIRSGAILGCHEAKISTAIMLHRGQGTAKDTDEAIQWLKSAAHVYYDGARALLMLGHIYAEQDDFDKALEAYHAAAAVKNYDRPPAVGDAQCALGCMYANGEGVEKDLEAARKWFELAVESGNEHAKTLLEKLEEERRTPDSHAAETPFEQPNEAALGAPAVESLGIDRGSRQWWREKAKREALGAQDKSR